MHFFFVWSRHPKTQVRSHPLLAEDVALEGHCLHLPECQGTNCHLLLSIHLISTTH